MRRILLIMFISVLGLAACGPSGARQATPDSNLTEEPVPGVNSMGYSNQAVGFSIVFPPAWQSNDLTANPVVFTLPGKAGTTLVEKSLEIQTTDYARECKQTTYAGGSSASSPQHVTINGVDLLKETGSDVGAGNIREWFSYSVMKDSVCINLTFVLHSVSAGVSSTEPAPFDRDAEIKSIDELIHTFRFR